MLLATNSEIPYRLIHTNEFNRNIYLLWLVLWTHAIERRRIDLCRSLHLMSLL